MQRYNLVTPVRAALIAGGYSTYLVVNAINAALGELDKTKESDKLGVGSSTRKGTKYSVTNTVSQKFEGKMTMPLLFDAWHCKVEAANKVASFDSIELPGIFNDWLGKMKKREGDSEETLAETPAA